MMFETDMACPLTCSKVLQVAAASLLVAAGSFAVSVNLCLRLALPQAASSLQSNRPRKRV
jgi:hypothetical protein